MCDRLVQLRGECGRRLLSDGIQLRHGKLLCECNGGSYADWEHEQAGGWLRASLDARAAEYGGDGDDHDCDGRSRLIEERSCSSIMACGNDWTCT